MYITLTMIFKQRFSNYYWVYKQSHLKQYPSFSHNSESRRYITYGGVYIFKDN